MADVGDVIIERLHLSIDGTSAGEQDWDAFGRAVASELVDRLRGCGGGSLGGIQLSVEVDAAAVAGRSGPRAIADCIARALERGAS